MKKDSILCRVALHIISPRLSGGFWLVGWLLYEEEDDDNEEDEEDEEEERNQVFESNSFRPSIKAGEINMKSHSHFYLAQVN